MEGWLHQIDGIDGNVFSTFLESPQLPGRAEVVNAVNWLGEIARRVETVGRMLRIVCCEILPPGHPFGTTMSASDFARRFGERLKDVRTRKGMSQEQLAHAAGLHRTHVSLIERNHPLGTFRDTWSDLQEPLACNRRNYYQRLRSSAMAKRLVHHPIKLC